MTMDLDTVNPQALNFQTTNFGAADGWMDFQSNDLGLEDFDTTLFGNIDSALTNFGMMEPSTVSFHYVNSSSTANYAFDLAGMPARRIDAGTMHLGRTDYGASDNNAISSFTTASMSCGTTSVRSTDVVMTGMGVLEYPTMNDDATHYHPMDLDNLNLSIRRTAMAGGQQVSSACPFLQPAAASQLTSAPNLGSPQHTKFTRVPTKKLPKRKCSGGRAARRRVTSDEWQEYRPFIEQLYIIENVKLTEVMKILKVKFGFEASYVTHPNLLPMQGPIIISHSKLC